MSWIKDNKFVAILAGATLIGVAGLAFLGFQGSQKYDESKAAFDNAASEATQYEKLPLYPRPENRDGKQKALGEYRKDVDDLQAQFAKYQPKELESISPQEFTVRLKTANTDIRQAFEASKTTVPAAFFVGFEAYTDSLAREQATGILNYQLNTVRDILLALAAAGPTELRNFHRPPLAEESGQAYAPAPTDVVRALPLEVTFKGTEKSMRQFLSALADSSKNYVVVRTLRIINEKNKAPLVADGKFEKTGEEGGATSTSPAPGGFVVPGQETEVAAPSSASNSSRILSQVLGNEEVIVFVRLDVLAFLPAKELPKP